MIDYSLLTEEERQMILAAPEVLEEGDADIALYMRYSSERQTEQSIEGQLRDAISYCRLKHYRIAAIYVDRATSAHKDTEKRVNFLRMISDSEKHRWQFVLVWKLDRFARNRTDSALYKFKLKKQGVRVLSVTENISDNPEGIILESVLEGMAEFYSAELSQKITRGLRETALKCNSVGGNIPLGYKVVDHKLAVDPVTAPIVQEAFRLYSEGETVAEICRRFNAAGYRTSKGAEFNRNSFKSMFANKKYIGVWTYKDMEIENGIPAIIDRETFETVSRRANKNAAAPARAKAADDYLLAGKAFCGHCGENIVGDCGRNQYGVAYHYYACAGRKRSSNCRLKSIRKKILEEAVVQDALALLTDEVIDEIAEIAVAQSEEEMQSSTRIPALSQRLDEIETSIRNITKAIEQGAVSDTLINRISDLEQEKRRVKKEIDEESKDVVVLEKSWIVFWLNRFKGGDPHDPAYRREIIDLLVNKVVIENDNDDPGNFYITVTFNLTSQAAHKFKISKKFGFGSVSSTIQCKSEFLIFGSLLVQTRKHPRS